MSDEEVVRAFRLPGALYERIRQWAETQSPEVSMQAAVRHLLERAMSELERKGKVPTNDQA